MKLPAQVGSSMVMVIDAIGSVNVIVIGWDCPCPSSLWKELKTSGTTYGSIVQVVGPHVPVAADRGQGSGQSVPHTAARCWTAAAAGRTHGVALETSAADVGCRRSNAPSPAVSTSRLRRESIRMAGPSPKG